MSNTTEPVTIAIPIAPAARQQARQFANEQSTPEKARQVYLNTLAVQVVNVYLQMMEIPTHLEASHSWQAVDRLCMDVADLRLPGIGNLECRPVTANDCHCVMPPEVWNGASDDSMGDRIGYLVVRIDDSERSGTILGFVRTVAQSTLTFSDLQPFDTLLTQLHHQRQSAQIASALNMDATTTDATTVNAAPTHLSQWFNNLIEVGWQIAEELLARKAPTVSFLGEVGQESSPAASTAAIAALIQTTQDEETRWQSAERLWSIDPTNPAGGVRRVHDLGLQLAGNAVALMVAVLQKSDELAILLRVYPMGNQRYLPPGLTLTGLYDDGNPFLVAAARDRDDYIQLKFCATPGERFRVRVSLADASITEHFVV